MHNKIIKFFIKAKQSDTHNICICIKSISLVYPLFFWLKSIKNVAYAVIFMANETKFPAQHTLSTLHSSAHHKLHSSAPIAPPTSWGHQQQ